MNQHQSTERRSRTGSLVTTLGGRSMLRTAYAKRAPIRPECERRKAHTHSADGVRVDDARPPLGTQTARAEQSQRRPPATVAGILYEDGSPALARTRLPAWTLAKLICNWSTRILYGDCERASIKHELSPCYVCRPGRVRARTDAHGIRHDNMERATRRDRHERMRRVRLVHD